MGTKKEILYFCYWGALVLRIFCVSILYGVCFGHNCYRNKDGDGTGPVVVTKTGTIVGKYVKVFDKKAGSFLGIPYAKPPTGEKRFTIAEPIDIMNFTLLAKEKSPACMQYSTRDEDWIPSPTLNFSEDCLYLNVWLPPNCCCNRSYKLPVMVWLHGGGYSSGSAMMDLYDGSVLATLGEVIVVTINYRLSVFGFLNVDSKEAPGNQGLYDQLLALKWVRENIPYFGGDPNSVTLFGESSGSISVSFQMISPLSRNLFHKAILESSTAAELSKATNVDDSFSTAKKFCELVGCSVDSSDRRSMRNDILNCLRNKTAAELAEADNYFTSKHPQFFTASYGNECEDCLKYFSGSPMKSAQTGDFVQLPTLIGVNKDESTIFMIYSMPSMFRKDRKTYFSNPIARQLLHDFFRNVKGADIPIDKVFDFYTKNIIKDCSDASPLHTITRIYGDFIIKCPTMYFADNVRNAYFYLFSHRSHKDPDDEWLGVPHFTEVHYVFGDPIRNSANYTSEDINISADIIQKWTSFAYHGYPVAEDSEPEWPKYSSSDRQVFELKSGKKRIIKFPSEKACDEVWRPIFTQ